MYIMSLLPIAFGDQQLISVEIFLLVDGTGNSCQISYLIKIKPDFSPQKW